MSLICLTVIKDATRAQNRIWPCCPVACLDQDYRGLKMRIWQHSWNCTDARVVTRVLETRVHGFKSQMRYGMVIVFFFFCIMSGARAGLFPFTLTFLQCVPLACSPLSFSGCVAAVSLMRSRMLLHGTLRQDSVPATYMVFGHFAFQSSLRPHYG